MEDVKFGNLQEWAMELVKEAVQLRFNGLEILLMMESYAAQTRYRTLLHLFSSNACVVVFRLILHAYCSLST